MQQLKQLTLGLIAAMISSQTLAGTFDVKSLDIAANADGDLSPIIQQANAAYAGAHSAPVYTQDVALISQIGDGDYALIVQESKNGTGNFAAITQAGHVQSVAFIYQGGKNNVAMIQQR